MRPNISCLLKVEPNQISVTWSQGSASFEPYHLDGDALDELRESAEKLRKCLSKAVDCYNERKPTYPQSSLELARVGHTTYCGLFSPEIDKSDPVKREHRQRAKEIRKWFENLRDTDNIESLEFVIDNGLSWSLPWNAMYDIEPDESRFLDAGDDRSHWEPFLGIRYNLTCGNRVDPRYRKPRLVAPHVLMVVDESVRKGLPEDEQNRLQEFSNVPIVGTVQDLREAIGKKRPDVIYWLSHAGPSFLQLNREKVEPRELKKLLSGNDDDDEEEFGGVAFLNGCRTAELSNDENDESFAKTFMKVGFSGFVGTEHRTINTFASKVGIDFLESFLNKGESIGSIMHRCRKEVPFGLLYGAYCPPGIHVVEAEVAKTHTVVDADAAEGIPLAARQPQRLPLPESPYPSLAYYTREDRALFVGRDDDVLRFASLLDRDECRLLVLHGESGVGKSSFLRAGVIPYLEDECVGYRFLSDQQQSKSNSQESESRDGVVFIRATNDLPGQLAQAILDFCDKPYQLETPTGNVEIDLKPVLHEVVGQEQVGAVHSQPTLRKALCEDLSLLGRIFARLSDPLPFTLLAIVDQCEEIFTLARNQEDEEAGRQALGMLRRTLTKEGDFKLILALRTEYHGRFTDNLRRGLATGNAMREYLLTDFSEDALVNAIARPTQRQSTLYSTETPFEKYGFSYEEGLPEQLAHRLVRHSTEQRDSVLPLLQVICTQLYSRTRDRADRTVTVQDLVDIGGVEGGLRSHVDGLLVQIDPTFKPKAPDAESWPSPLEKSDPIRHLFTKLFNRQADGRVTTALVSQEQLATEWNRPDGIDQSSYDQMPFDKFLASALDVRLLRVSTLRIGDEEERRVSLGHDSLARIAAEWQEEFTARARLQRVMRIIATVSAVAVLMACLAGWALVEKGKAERAQAESEHFLQTSLSTLGPLLGSTASRLEFFPYVQGIRGELLEESRAELEKLRSRKPDSSELLDKYALALMSLGNLRTQSRWDADKGQHIAIIENQEARECYEKAAVLFNSLDSHSQHASSLYALGNLDYEEGKLESASGHYERARVVFTNEVGAQHPLVRQQLAGLKRNQSLIALKQGQHELAADLLKEALTIQKKVCEELPNDHESLNTYAQMLSSEAINAQLKGQYSNSLSRFDRVVELYDSLVSADFSNPRFHIESNRNRTFRAELNRRDGNLVGAAGDYRTSIQSYHDILKVLPNSRPFVVPYVEAQTNYLRLLNGWDNNDLAWQTKDEPIRTMLDLKEVYGLAPDEDVVWGFLKLVQGRVATDRGPLRNAESSITEAKKIFGKLRSRGLPEYDSRLAFAHYAHAMLYRNSEDIPHAIEEYHKALEILNGVLNRSVQPSDLESKAMFLFELADAEFCLDEKEAAKAHFQESIRIQTEELARFSSDIVKQPSYHHGIAWFHCFCVDDSLRNLDAAVDAAQKGCQLIADKTSGNDPGPEDGPDDMGNKQSVEFQAILGIALYRAGEFERSAKALSAARELNNTLAETTQSIDSTGNPTNAVRYKPGLVNYFTAMAESQRPDPDLSLVRSSLEQARDWKETQQKYFYFMKRIDSEATEAVGDLVATSTQEESAVDLE